jgi:hypothetical protein
MPLPLTDILDVKTLRRVGKQYRLKFPQEDGQERLVELLQQHANLDSAIADDYTNDRLVVLDGWMLSVTEGRQAALFSYAKNRFH